MKNPDDRLLKEPKLAYAAFVCYRDERDLSQAYNNFMQQNETALTTMNAFMKWASTYSWQRRVNDYDDWQEIRTERETRLLGRKNALTAEEMGAELFTCVREEMELKKSTMTHSDMVKYLGIAVKINEKWVKQPDTSVTVNVDNNINNMVDIPDEVLREIGRKLVEDESDDAT